MNNTENLHFKIGLSGTLTDKKPKFTISVNDIKLVDAEIKLGANQTEYFEFDAEVAEGECKLSIDLLNKTVHDTVLDENKNIIKDLLLNIDSIEIEDIDLGSLLWTASDYVPNYPETYRAEISKQGQHLPVSVKNCVNLGWNGQWSLPFASPFYIWLLENI